MFRRKKHADGPEGAAPAAPSPMDELRQVLAPWFAAAGRPGWRPQTTPEEPTTSASKFCGAPWLLPHEVAPTCAHCGRELQLFVQLELDALPAAYGTGVLQLYYCVGQVGPEPDGHPACWAEDAWEPFSDRSSLVRVVPRQGLQAMVTSVARMKEFPPAAIVGWVPMVDLPDPADHEAAGLIVDDDPDTGITTVRCPDLGIEFQGRIDDLEVYEVCAAADGDKLGGWPLWVQDDERPSCPRCSATMRVVFQIDSENHVPYMFGDSGVGHITQCPEHHDVVAFGWACA